MDDETGLQMFAERNGIDWKRAKAEMLEGDVTAAAKQLRHAKAAKSKYDRDAVLGWLKLCAQGRNNGR